MATVWVSSSARGGADGTSYADAYGSISDGLGDLSSVGDILNIVNDGTHTWPTSETDVNNLAGSSYASPGCIIRGTDSNGTAAIATIAPAASGVHRMVRFTGSTAYTIIENLIFDATSQVADANIYSAVRWNGAGQSNHKARYCAMLGGPSGSLAAGTRTLASVATIAGSGDEGISEYCYYQNINGQALLNARMYRYRNCVYINDSGAQRTGTLFSFGTIAASQSDRITDVHNCTIYDNTTSNTQDVINFTSGPGLNAGTANVYSNLVWIETTGLVNPFFGGSAASTSVTHIGTINGNVLLGGPSVSAGDLNTPGWYELPWDANDDDATDPDHWPSDTVAYGVADTTVFNDPSSTYDWELPNGLTITILKDLRPIQYKTAGLYGDTPGALPKIAGTDYTDKDDPTAVPFLDVRPFFAPVLELEANVRLSTVRNRNQEHYLRMDVENQRWSEFSARRITIATNTETRLRSGIETVAYLLVESDNAVRLNSDADEDVYLPAAKQIVVLGGSKTVLKLKNESTSDTATPLTVMVD